MTIYYTENEKDFSLLMQKLEERGIVHAPTNVRPTQVSFSDFSLANNCVRVDNNEKVFHVAAKEYYETNFPEETIINFKQEEEKKCRIYHTETQEDYDALMIELEAEGCKWFSGRKPTKSKAGWVGHKENTCIKVSERRLTREEIEFFKKRFPHIPIIEHKEKVDEKMKIYHTETQADYDALMVELEGDGVTWRFGALPTKENNWKARTKNMCVRVSHQVAEYGSIDTYLKIYPDVPIIKYKEKVDAEMKFTKENVEIVIYHHLKETDEFILADIVSDIYDMVETLDDTPEKVAVPKFVAEWIEWNNKTGVDLKIVLKRYGRYCNDTKSYSGEYSEKAVQWYVDNPYKFIRAYEDGYTIEPEQLYYIPLPDLETSDRKQQVLSKHKDDKGYFEGYFACCPSKKLKQRYTKEELEQVPEIYKPFAKPIEEVAE